MCCVRRLYCGRMGSFLRLARTELKTLQNDGLRFSEGILAIELIRTASEEKKESLKTSCHRALAFVAS